ELVRRAREVASLLAGTLRQALFGTEAPAADAGDRYLAQERFWDRTEATFRERIAELAEALERAPDEEALRAVIATARETFDRELQRAALSIFDELVRFEAIEDQRTMDRKIAARRWLVASLSSKNEDAPAERRRRRTA
ncbi:MAG: type I-E CRISPR-associated protein Cse1/CasA, partial [Geminicoccaceae bacterium]|nr:type I-E CRISPR-associated protein Cse1/CasA [Geminicoccaceae bacterium]